MRTPPLSGMLAISGPRFDLLWHKGLRVNTCKLIRQTGEVQIPRNRTMRCGEDRVHRPSAPAADWVCPKLVFTEATALGALDTVDLGKARVFERDTHGVTRAVRLDHAEAAGIHARRGQRRPAHRGLRVRRRYRDIHSMAVLVSAVPGTTPGPLVRVVVFVGFPAVGRIFDHQVIVSQQRLP
jgi:hypothetical protein